jgi:N-acetylglucosaminyldiphosphoundecaprenol N-acetyl-beta-D-mannosaminyltransferase
LDILGVRIDEVSMDDAVKQVDSFFESNRFHMIFTPNPEFIMIADKDSEFKNILNSSDLNIPDGNGIVWASRKMRKPLKERVAGFDFIHKIFDLGKDRDISFYFLGAKKGVADKAKEEIEAKFIGVDVIGVHDGYFDESEEKEIIQEINRLKPDVLLVAMGCPRQEKFIYRNRNVLNSKIAVGVGGCFDVISGKVKRAPDIFIKLKLEWLYRGITDFRRLKRLMIVPQFIIKVITNKKEIERKR